MKQCCLVLCGWLRRLQTWSRSSLGVVFAIARRSEKGQSISLIINYNHLVHLCHCLDPVRKFDAGEFFYYSIQELETSPQSQGVPRIFYHGDVSFLEIGVDQYDKIIDKRRPSRFVRHNLLHYSWEDFLTIYLDSPNELTLPPRFRCTLQSNQS